MQPNDLFHKIGPEKLYSGLMKYSGKELAAKWGVDTSTIWYWKTKHLTPKQVQEVRKSYLGRRAPTKRTKLGYSSLDGELLKSVRTNAGLTLRQLASKTKIPFQTISDLERGHTKLTPERVDILADTLSKFVDKAYVAGLFDRKSSIGILKVKPVTRKELKEKNNGGSVTGPTFLVRVEFRSKHKLLIDLIQKVMGCGTLTSVNNTHVFMAWSANGERVLNTLMPYLKVKRRQAELCLELREMQKDNKKFRLYGLSDEYIERAEALRLEIIRLNTGVML